MKLPIYPILTLLLLSLSQRGYSQWSEINETIFASFHNTAVAWEGKVYFTGGPATQAVAATTYNNKVEVLDLETGEVEQVPGMLSVGRAVIGGIAHNGKIYFAGGQKWITSSPGLQVFNNLDIFDVATQTWTYTQMPTAKTAFAVAVVNDKILFAGGYVSVSGQIIPTAGVNVYNPADSSWSNMGLSQARGELSAGVMGNKVWFCGGGRSWVSWVASSRVDIYDGDENAWDEAELSSARAWPAVATAGPYLICAGGYTNTIGNSNKVDMLNTSTGYWSTAFLSAPRCGMAAATIGNKAYFTGGGHLNLAVTYLDASSNKVDMFDATDSTWTTSTLNKNRMAHSCAAWGNKIAVGGGWRAEQVQTTGRVEILTDSGSVAVKDPVVESYFSIFPNPTADYITVSFTENRPYSENTAMLVTDLSGKVLHRKELAPDEWGKDITIQLNGIPAGGYFLIVDAGEQGRAVQRFVVLR